MTTARSSSAYQIDGIADPVLQIGTYGTFRREDFMFPRTQSRTMSGAPWAERLQPQRSWGEIIGTGLVVGVASLALALSTLPL
jgi:hypothetical protein